MKASKQRARKEMKKQAIQLAICRNARNKGGKKKSKLQKCSKQGRKEKEQVAEMHATKKARKQVNQLEECLQLRKKGNKQRKHKKERKGNSKSTYT